MIGIDPVVTGLLRMGVQSADCTRRKVACVLTLDGLTVGIGFNRLPVGQSCEAGDCPRGQMSYEEQPADVGYEASGCHSVHAEDMALANAGEDARGAVAWLTEWPCPRCYDRLKGAGVVGVMLHVDPVRE